MTSTQLPHTPSPHARLPLFGGASMDRPGAEFGLHLFEKRYVDMAKEAVKSDGRFGFITSRAPSKTGAGSVGGAGSTGWQARITSMQLNENGTIDIRAKREGRVLVAETPRPATASAAPVASTEPLAAAPRDTAAAWGSAMKRMAAASSRPATAWGSTMAHTMPAAGGRPVSLADTRRLEPLLDRSDMQSNELYQQQVRQLGRRVGLEHQSFAAMAPGSAVAVAKGSDPMGGDAPDRWVKSSDYYGSAAKWKRTGDARLVPAGAELATWKAQYPKNMRAMTWRERGVAASGDARGAVGAAYARRQSEVAASGGGRRRVEPGRSNFGLADGRATYRG